MGRVRSERKREMMQRLAESDGWICWLCQQAIDPEAALDSGAAASLDHVTPYSEGGRNTQANLRLAHKVCNAARAGHNVIAPPLLTKDSR